MSNCRLGRHAGLLVPLVSMPSSRSWGIGEIADIPVLAAWLRDARLDLLQLLPISELPAHETSPYAALSAMAIDPVFISAHALEDFTALGGERGADARFRGALARLRRRPTSDIRRVRRLKMQALAAAFDHFHAVEWKRHTSRAEALREYLVREQWWIDDYALFRALRTSHDAVPWTDWDPSVRERRPEALAAARRTYARQILFFQYLQWIADLQWQTARQMAPIGLYGDLPFTVAADSADVWARQADFRLDASVGTPPDAFSEEGQDWGTPAYRWDVTSENEFDWQAARARRAAALFDGYRVDHLVGFYRTFIRSRDGAEPYFDPPDEPGQLVLGERLMQLFCGTGAHVIAEDLGTVPAFVRASLAGLGVPGFRVLRWEREWQEPGQPFRDPLAYPSLSVATTGTHDTEPLAAWWNELPVDDRVKLGEIPMLASRPLDYASLDFGPALRDAILEMLWASGSNLLILPIQDLFGWRDRINIPGVADAKNWTFKLPWPVDTLQGRPEARERALQAAEWGRRYGRAENDWMIE